MTHSSYDFVAFYVAHDIADEILCALQRAKYAPHDADLWNSGRACGQQFSGC
jgi:hypothetical protein